MEPRREKKHWSPIEDTKLEHAISERPMTPEGKIYWPGIAAEAGLQRTDKNCWERWTMQLRPDLKKGAWSPEEDDTIIRLHRVYGNQWASMTDNPVLQGRSPNAIKNRWNNHLKMILQKLGLLENNLLMDDETSDHSDRGVDLQAYMDDLASAIHNIHPNESSSS